MPRGRLIALAVVTEGALAVAAWAAAWMFNLTMMWGKPSRDLAIGTVAAVVLAAVNYTILYARTVGVDRRRHARGLP